MCRWMVPTFVKRLYLASAFTRYNFGVPAEDLAQWMCGDGVCGCMAALSLSGAVFVH